MGKHYVLGGAFALVATFFVYGRFILLQTAVDLEWELRQLIPRDPDRDPFAANYAGNPMSSSVRYLTRLRAPLERLFG
jgi:hypothetical protein